MIDIELVQKLIEKEISPDFEINKWHDAGDFIIIFWKHKNYDADDERGMIVGPGPVLYEKSKNEYRLMGSGEWFYGDYANYIDESLYADNRRDYEIIMSLLDGVDTDSLEICRITDRITKNIVRRNYVNSDDIDYLSILTGARRIGLPFDMKSMPGLKRGDHLMVAFENKKSHLELMRIWEEIGFKYEILSDTELLLWKIKT